MVQARQHDCPGGAGLLPTVCVLERSADLAWRPVETLHQRSADYRFVPQRGPIRNASQRKVSAQGLGGVPLRRMKNRSAARSEEHTSGTPVTDQSRMPSSA